MRLRVSFVPRGLRKGLADPAAAQESRTRQSGVNLRQYTVRRPSPTKGGRLTRLSGAAGLWTLAPECASAFPGSDLSLGLLDGPELPILLVLLGCLSLGVLLSQLRRRPRRDEPPAASAEPAAKDAAQAVSPVVSESRPCAGWLIAVDGAPVHHAIEQLPFRIGRSIGNDLVLSDPSVSRYHAEVDLRPDGGIAITDLDSLNGVYLAGKRIAHSRLFDGCRIEIGDVALQYTRDPPAVAEGGTLVLAVPRRKRP